MKLSIIDIKKFNNKLNEQKGSLVEFYIKNGCFAHEKPVVSPPTSAKIAMQLPNGSSSRKTQRKIVVNKKAIQIMDFSILADVLQTINIFITINISNKLNTSLLS